MKKLIKKILRKILNPIINESIRADKNYGYILEAKTLIESYTVIIESSIGSNCKLNSPYRLVKCKVDDYTYIAENSKISITQIGKFCSIGPNFLCGWGIHPTNALSTSPMFYSTIKQNGMTLSEIDKVEERKQIIIGNDVFIGANVMVLDGVVIGDGAIIGAGAIVSKDIPAYTIAVGNPIKLVKYRFEENKIEELLKIKWWDFPNEKLGDVEKYFFEVNTFIEKHLNA